MPKALETLPKPLHSVNSSAIFKIPENLLDEILFKDNSVYLISDKKRSKIKMKIKIKIKNKDIK